VGLKEWTGLNSELLPLLGYELGSVAGQKSGMSRAALHNVAERS